MGVSQIIVDLIIIFFTAIISGLIARKFRQPLILGYLIGGIIVGGITGIGSSARSEITLFAELGIALLMFLLGIEFSFRRFKRVRDIVIWGGTIQILTTVVLGIFIFRLLGLDFYSSLFLGSVFALSSTAVVVKLLSEKGMIQTLHGEISLGWLIIQDLAVLPIAILLPAIKLSANQLTVIASLTTLGQGVGVGLAYVFIVLFLGRFLVPLIFNFISKTSSRELLLLTSFSFCIVVAGITQMIGFSFTLGAFLAGILVSQTEVMQAVFSEIRPIRDLFSTVFFVSLGFLINPSFILKSWPLIVGLVILVVVLKFLIVFGLTFSFGYHSKIAFLTAIALVQVGEFAFVLAQLGLSQKIINESLYSLILSVAIITIVFTPPLINNSSVLYQKLYPLGSKLRFLRLIFEKRTREISEQLTQHIDHVILLGYGRVGKYIGRALAMEKIPFVVVDYNRFIVDKLQSQGIAAVYGDPADLTLLSFVNVERAKALVVAIPDLPTQKAAITNSLTLNRQIKIYCRTHYEEDQKILKTLGCQEIIQPEFEASLTIVNKLLEDFRVSKTEIEKKSLRLKSEHIKA